MKMIKRITAIALCAVTMMGVFPNTVSAYEDENSYMHGEIGFSIGTHRDFNGTVEKSRLEFRPREGATYTATSSNNEVLKIEGVEVISDSLRVTKEGKYILPEAYINVEGISKGTATVTLNRTLNGRTKAVGKSKVTVSQADVSTRDNYEHNYPLGTDYISSLRIDNINLNAKYVFEVDKEGLTVRDHIEEGRRDVKFTATKTGTYKVTAKEITNGKERVLKTITINIHDLKIKDKVTLELDQVGMQSKDISDYWDLDYATYYEIDGISSIYEPISNSDFITYANRTHTPLIIVRNHLRPLKLGEVVVKVYRIPQDTSYELISNSKTGNTDFEKEYLGTTTITIVPEGSLNK